MGKAFRRKLRQEFGKGNFGPLDPYIRMDFSSTPGTAYDKIVLGALEYLFERYEGVGSLSERVCDVTIAFTETVPIYVPKISLHDLESTKKDYERLITWGGGNIESLDGIWRAILRVRKVNEDFYEIDKKKLIKILIEFYKERIAQGKAVSSVLAGS